MTYRDSLLVVASLAWVRPRLGGPVDGTKPAWRFKMPFAQAELRTAENLSNMPEKLEQSAPPIPEMGGALLKRCLMDRHYSHAVTTQADVVSRRHLQVAFPRDVSRDAGGNDTPAHEVIAHGLRP